MTTAAAAEEISGSTSAYRTSFIAVVIAYYAAWIALWLWGPPTLVALLQQLQNITPAVSLLQGPSYAHFPTPFIDLAAMFSWRECFLQGVDVTVIVPCDPVQRGPANYSPLVWHLPYEWIGFRNVVPAAMVLDTLFLLLMFSMFQPRTRAECLIMTLAMVSPVTFFALERCNLDIPIFLLILGAFLLPQNRRWGRITAYGAIWIGGLLKFYPFVLLATMLRERPGRFLVLASASLAALAGLILWQLPYLSRLVLPKEFVYGMFGARVLGEGLRQELGLQPAGAAIVTILCCAASFTAMTVLARKFVKPVGALNLLDRDSGTMVCGGILTLACFFSGFNVYYRAVFLLPVIPGLFDLFQGSKERSIRLWFGLGLLATLACLYSDMFGFLGTKVLKFWFPFNSDSAPSHIIASAILLAKEAVWWLAVTVLGGILIAALPHAQTVKQSLTYLPWRRSSAGVV